MWRWRAPSVVAGGAVRLCRALATDAAEKGATATTRRFRQHVNPLAAQYREPMELPEWSTAFANPSLPIHLDIGCARGRYLMQVAEQQSERTNFVGIEIRRNVLDDAALESKRRGLQNLVFLHGNMNVQQKLLLGSLPAPVRSVSIFHPDPWMKKRHLKRRLVTDEFVRELATLLPKGTPVYLQTDVEELFMYMVEIFEGSQLYTPELLPENPFALPTDREAFVKGQGGDIFRVAFCVGAADDQPQQR